MITQDRCKILRIINDEARKTMSFSQFGYPYHATSQFFVSANPSTTCCDSVSRSLSDGSGGSQTVSPLCCPSYGSGFLASTGTELNAALGMYSSPYAATATASQNYANYLQYSADATAFYSSLNSQYDMKDGTGNLHTGISQTAGYYPCDPTLGQYHYERYGAVDLNGSARRKNATRETTSTLKTWLSEHRKNPYPTKGEKIMLAIITKMTLTQVSTWFANARRRLKKENKMTWAAKNKPGEMEKEHLEKPARDCTTAVSKDCKETYSALSVQDDVDEDMEGEQDSDCENTSAEGRQAVNAQCPSRDSSGTLAIPSCCNAFPCSEKNSANPATSFTAPLELRPLTAAQPLTSVDSLPRIWSLAHGTAAGLFHSPCHNGDTGKSSVSCQLLSPMVPAARRGRCAGLEGRFEMPDPQSDKKEVASPFSQTPLQPHCSSYNILSKSCQYLPPQGFSREGRTETMLPELQDTFNMPQKEKAMVFIPVLKR